MLLALVLALSVIPMVGHAEGESTSDTSADKLQLTVQFPDDVRCGVPLTIGAEATGGSGSYLYRMDSLLVYDGTTWVNVIDVSTGSEGTFSETNQWQFTFYTSGTYYFRFTVKDVGVSPNTTYTTGFYSNALSIVDEDYPSVSSIVSQVAAECEANCSTDFEKALWLHDWLISNADYDYSYRYCSAEGVLARGTGTCESYHRAYVLLLNKVGIKTGRITGNNHVWTAALLDGNWTQIDTTWDDMGDAYSGSFFEHLYFGLNDELMGLAHSDHTKATTGYESTTLEENYFIKTGEISTWSDPFISQIQSALDEGQEDFSIATPTYLSANVRNILYRLVAYQLNKEDWGDVTVTVTFADDALHCQATYPATDETEPQETEPAETEPAAPTTTEPAAGETGDTTSQDNAAQTDTTPETSTEEPSTEAPSTEEPDGEEPSTEAPSTEEPDGEQTSTEAPSTEEPDGEQSSTETPSTEEPDGEQPSTEAPSTEEPDGEQTSTETPSTEEPDGEQTSTEEPAQTTPDAETSGEEPIQQGSDAETPAENADDNTTTDNTPEESEKPQTEEPAEPVPVEPAQDEEKTDPAEEESNQQDTTAETPSEITEETTPTSEHDSKSETEQQPESATDGQSEAKPVQPDQKPGTTNASQSETESVYQPHHGMMSIHQNKPLANQKVNLGKILISHAHSHRHENFGFVFERLELGRKLLSDRRSVDATQWMFAEKITMNL
jgi:hypothetical protein